MLFSRPNCTVFCTVVLLALSTKSLSREPAELWQDLTQKIIVSENRSGLPSSFRSLKLDLPSLISLLNQSTDEDDPDAFANGPVISLPMPDGSFSRFRVALSPMIPPLLANAFPGIRAFTATGIDDPHAVAKLDYTDHGFHAMIMSPKGWVFIDPANQGNTIEYISYYKASSQRTHDFNCETSGNTVGMRNGNVSGSHLFRTSGATLKTYRLAVACTGEYASFHGGTVSTALSAIVTSVNRVNGVYETEQAVRLVLVPNNNAIVFTNASTDPYTNGSGSAMLSQNQSTLTNLIGSSNYDIGHVFSTGGGGVAYLGAVCNASIKAGGVTGSANPIGDAFDIDYVAHEMGHQFGGNHTFNGTAGSCSSNRVAAHAYEPGSGTTIMAYAGICGADNIQPNSDPFFHTDNYDEIQQFITTGGGNTCATASSTGNSPPQVPPGGSYTIPFNTPFVLTGSGTDPDADPLTFLWEQYDLGPAGSPNSPSGNAPLFRDWTPVTTPVRVFPRMEALVRNQQSIGEILPSYARSLVFRFTARDNKTGGGGVAYNNTPVSITVVNTGTPFRVANPNSNVIWPAGSVQTVSWDESGTSNPPVSCQHVNIFLSVDSGYTYPYTLALNTPNDGSEAVTIPAVMSNRARIKVESVGNIFFDISDVNFTITSASTVLSAISTTSFATNSRCAGNAYNVAFTIDAPGDAGNVFTAQLSDASGSFSNPVNIGSLTAVNAGTIVVTIPAYTPPGNSYRIRVVSSSPVVTGTDNGSNIIISKAVITPGAITGSHSVCQGQTGVAYSLPAVTNATGYNWSLPPGATITGGANTNSIVVSFSTAAVSGNITVQGSNTGCGNGPVSAPFSVNVLPLPSAAGNIAGTSYVCAGTTNVAYSVAPINDATDYVWSLPLGATIASGNNTHSITVDFSDSASSGAISVVGTNSCGSGVTSAAFPIVVNTLPASPVVSADGSTALCVPGSVTLSFNPSPGVSYQWRRNGVALTGEKDSSYTASVAGSYDVVATFTSIPPQVFSNNNPVTIPDNTCTGASGSITVSGYSGSIMTGDISLVMNIQHTYVGDLAIMLQSPDGKVLGLSNRTGNSSNGGDDFINTGFSDAAAYPLPTSGTPYSGIYLPVPSLFYSCMQTTITSFSSIGGGVINPNGTWTLKVFDRASIDVGSILDWSLSFPQTIPNACSITSNSVVVTEIIPVAAGVSISVSPGNTICEGMPVTFTAIAVNGGASPEYQWKLGAAGVGTNSPDFTTTLTNGSMISCVMTSDAGCVSGSPAVSDTITMVVNPAPAISVFSPSSGGAGTVVVIEGAGFLEVTDVSFNGVSTAYTIISDQMITASVPAGSSSGFISMTAPCGSATSVSMFSTAATVTYNIKALIEGFYLGGGLMYGVISSAICDTLEVSLAGASPPNAILYSTRGTIDKQGNGTFYFPGQAFGNEYYIVVNHRNSLRAWSATSLMASETNSYDFTIAASQAYGSNLSDLGNGLFALISGDINKDDIIDELDLLLLQAGAASFISGYVNEDLTGDSQVESADYSIIENNLSVILMRP